MKYLVLSDIHGNLSALEAVLHDAQRSNAPNESDFDGIILLGDNIDYGMRSNEVVAKLDSLELPIICSIWGNHENAILASDFERFSSERGRKCAKNTARLLDESSRTWLNRAEHSGMTELDIEGNRTLVVHGSIDDPLWGTLAPMKTDLYDYSAFDIVLSGHSHVPHLFTALLPYDNPKMRNKKAVIFVNPGSVGQPRNHNPRSSYAVWDTDKGFQLHTVPYDIVFEQSLYDGSVNAFYRDRLSLGI